MGTATIRQAIRDACDQEQQGQALRRYFETHLAVLTTHLVLPDKDPVEALEQFSHRYINYVPEFLERVREQAVAQQAGEDVETLLNMAEDFFLAPPGAVHTGGGLQALMDEAFLAQRLIEEVNDRFMRSHGRALVNVDMTRANIIAHHLVGEPLASRLEGLVARSVELVASRSGLFEPLEESHPAPAARLDLPCMSRDVAVGLRLEARPQGLGNQDSGFSV